MSDEKFDEFVTNDAEEFDWKSLIDENGHVEIPDAMTKIGGSAFENCDNLVSIAIPKNVENICSWDMAFVGCKSLKQIQVDPNNLFYWSDGVTLFNKEKTCLLACAYANIGSHYEIKDGVVEVGSCAFWGCSSLTSVTIPNSVTGIGISAFRECSSLATVAIPGNVTRIGAGAFRDCSSLTTITIPVGVTRIGMRAFAGCSSLTSFVILNRVTYIDRMAFWRCSSLTSMTIPNSVKTIKSLAFAECSSLRSITIPKTVKEVGVCLFYKCSALKEVQAPKRFKKQILEDVGEDCAFIALDDE